MVERSLYEGIQCVVFEPNNHRLGLATSLMVVNFMNGQFRSGAFQGWKASDACFVRRGLSDIMTQGDVETGKLFIEVAITPVKPAEFIVLRLQQ